MNNLKNQNLLDLKKKKFIKLWNSTQKISIEEWKDYSISFEKESCNIFDL